MNGSIYTMNHSPKTQELEFTPPPFERNSQAIYDALVKAHGAKFARETALAMTGKGYEALCAGMLAALNCDDDAQERQDLHNMGMGA